MSTEREQFEAYCAENLPAYFNGAPNVVRDALWCLWQHLRAQAPASQHAPEPRPTVRHRWSIPVKLPDDRICYMRKDDLKPDDMVVFFDSETYKPNGAAPADAAREALVEECKRLASNFATHHDGWEALCVVINRLAALPAPAVPASSAVNRLREIAHGVELYGAPDKSLLARRLEAVADELVSSPEAAAGVSSEWRPGEWYQAQSVDDMQQFYKSRLPAVREAAREHGYAIAVHGSERRDFDLIATPWREGASDANTLAHAVAMAACGITRQGDYQFEQKPLGRLAVSIPVCWTSRPDVVSDGHIDLSVVPAVAAQPQVPQLQQAIDRLNAQIRWLRHGKLLDDVPMMAVTDMEVLRDALSAPQADACKEPLNSDTLWQLAQDDCRAYLCDVRGSADQAGMHFPDRASLLRFAALVIDRTDAERATRRSQQADAAGGQG
jgi:hypothetical protein